MNLLNSLCMVASITFKINDVPVSPWFCPHFTEVVPEAQRGPRVTQQVNGGTSLQILIYLTRKPVLRYAVQIFRDCRVGALMQ